MPLRRPATTSVMIVVECLFLLFWLNSHHIPFVNGRESAPSPEKNGYAPQEGAAVLAASFHVVWFMQDRQEFRDPATHPRRSFSPTVVTPA